MNQFALTLTWLSNGSHWVGADGLATRLLEHLEYTALAVVIAAVLAVPAGLVIGHTGRGRTAAVALTGALRSLPSLGLLTLLAVATTWGITRPVVPATIVLVLLAIPPLLAGSYSGVEAIDPDVVDGARACGMSPRQVLARVEIPLATPLLLGGLRSAVLQVVATATICSYLGMGGLGRPILDGLAVSDYPQMLAGAIIVIALALLLDLLLSLAGRVATGRGVRTALALD
ncbi:ABC transporter permease [Acidipropionibacterium timonense]|uniref:ABC transporter permease n=1 Tax=Acidipropionibacterium timonense TaxID=2161818 RepID=UPI001031A4F4|nr:ABC transporter permease subunit [Acidipropionibacterium timonense]